MAEWHRDDGYVVTDDTTRIDREFVWHWLAHESYWAQGRTREVMDRAIDGSLCFALYAPDGSPAGFCRQVTDRATFAFLSDVFVIDEHRGSGAGTFMVRVAIEHPDMAGVRQQTLRTQDAHGLYAKFGYRAINADELPTWMVRYPLAETPPAN